MAAMVGSGGNREVAKTRWLRTVRALTFLVATLLPVAVDDVAAATLRVMSFNLRNVTTFDNLFVPPNGWFDFNDLGNPDGLVNGRRVRAIATIDAFAPDVLGVQEPDQIQIDDLLNEFPEYGYFGVGRDDGAQLGEQNGIFYRADRFAPIDGGHFWLSDTPTVPGTTFATSFDSGNSRMATWLILHDVQTDSSFFALNTHWSLSSSARTKSARLIREMVPDLSAGLPILITGDLNTSESSSAFRILRDGELPTDVPLLDAYREVFPNRQSTENTFHDYSGSIFGSRIDHILASGDHFQPIDASIDRSEFDGFFPSDHFPVTATFRVVPEPSAATLLISGAVAWLVFARRRRLLTS